MISEERKIWIRRQYEKLRGLPFSIYFNFHYLPLYQAIHLPILLYKPHFKALRGKVLISSNMGGVKFGMIRLGFTTVSIYPQKGVIFENHGGTIIFRGKCHMGNGTAISIGSNGYLDVGDGFSANTMAKIVCYHRIELAENVCFGWDCMIMDTDFHYLTKECGGYSKGYAPIRIGRDAWFGNGCRIMKRTILPERCVVQSGTTLSEPIDVPPCSIIGHDHCIVVKASGAWRDPQNNLITNYPA